MSVVIRIIQSCQLTRNDALEVSNYLVVVAILQDSQEVHQLQGHVVVAVPLILAGEVLVDGRVDFLADDAQSHLVEGLVVHQCRPQVGRVLANLDDVEERRLDKRVEEVDQIIVVAIKQDVAEGEVAMASADGHHHVPHPVHDLAGEFHQALCFLIVLEVDVFLDFACHIGHLVGEDVRGHRLHCMRYLICSKPACSKCSMKFLE